jgi:hypothetical protein
MNATSNQSAEQAYAAARERVDSLRARLEHLLDAHQEKHSEWRGDWGYVGDLNHVVVLLADAVGFLEAGS